MNFWIFQYLKERIMDVRGDLLVKERMTDVRGDLHVKVMRGIDLQNPVVFGVCNPYVLVKLRSSPDTMTTAVKDGDANPSWKETFTFRDISSTDELQISLMEKDGERERVVSVSDGIPSNLWGFPGTGGVERELHVTMPNTNGRMPEASSMGTVILKMQYRAKLPFRAPFGVIKTAAAKTGELTEKANIDLAVDKILNATFRRVEMARGMFDRIADTEKIFSSGYAASIAKASALLRLLALAVLMAFLAIFFLPLIIVGGLFLVLMVVMLMPLALVLTWIVICTRPVQCRIWLPAVFWMVETIPTVKKILFKPRAPGTMQ